jgi:hypothetical protein
MLWRKINLELLFKSGLLYRLFIFVAQTIFFWAMTRQLKPAFGNSVLWNGINLLLYYLYHYFFYRMYAIGINEQVHPG